MFPSPRWAFGLHLAALAANAIAEELLDVYSGGMRWENHPFVKTQCKEEPSMMPGQPPNWSGNPSLTLTGDKGSVHIAWREFCNGGNLTSAEVQTNINLPRPCTKHSDCESAGCPAVCAPEWGRTIEDPWMCTPQEGVQHGCNTGQAFFKTGIELDRIKNMAPDQVARWAKTAVEPCEMWEMGEQERVQCADGKPGFKSLHIKQPPGDEWAYWATWDEPCARSDDQRVSVHMKRAGIHDFPGCQTDDDCKWIGCPARCNKDVDASWIRESGWGVGNWGVCVADGDGEGCGFDYSFKLDQSKWYSEGKCSFYRRLLSTSRAEMRKPDSESPELEKPELEKPESERPELEKPESERPELKSPLFDECFAFMEPWEATGCDGVALMDKESTPDWTMWPQCLDMVRGFMDCFKPKATAEDYAYGDSIEWPVQAIDEMHQHWRGIMETTVPPAKPGTPGKEVMKCSSDQECPLGAFCHATEEGGVCVQDRACGVPEWEPLNCDHLYDLDTATATDDTKKCADFLGDFLTCAGEKFDAEEMAGLPVDMLKDTLLFWQEHFKSTVSKAPEESPCQFPEWKELGCEIFSQGNSTCGGTTLPLVSHVCDDSSPGSHPGCKVAVAYELAGHTCEHYCKHAGLVCVSAHVVNQGVSAEEACAEAEEKRASWENCDMPFPTHGKAVDPKVICDCGGFTMESHPKMLKYDVLQAKSCIGVFDRYIECSTKTWGPPDPETMFIRDKLVQAAAFRAAQKCVFIDQEVADRVGARQCTKEYLDLVAEQKIERENAWRR